MPANTMIVELFLDGPAGELVLNRPEKINAMNDALVAALQRQLDAAAEEGVRALMLRGEGRGFSAGRDLSDARPGEDARAVLENVFNSLIRRMASFPAPTVAAVHGPCLGSGLGLALACDVIYVADDAQLGSPFARIGAVLDSGAHAAFVSRLGAHRALELIYTGRMLSGQEADAWGMVNLSLPQAELFDRARTLTREIAQGPTAAFLESKRLVRRIQDEALGFAEVLAAEAIAQGAASKTEDYREGISAFQQKRRPSFIGR